MADKRPQWEDLLDEVPDLTPRQRALAKVRLVQRYPNESERLVALVEPQDARKNVLLALDEWTIWDELCFIFSFGTRVSQPSEPTTKDCPGGPSYTMEPVERRLVNDNVHLRQRNACPLKSGAMQGASCRVPKTRFRLGMLPTPIHEWRLQGLPEGVRLLVKRDDLSGMQLSGNKVRKLEFLLAEAVQGGHDCVVTIGGIQSNHARATAVAARYLGLDCHLILRTSRQRVGDDPGLVGNLLVERLVGAELHLVTKEEYGSVGSTALLEQLRQELEAAGRKPYVIPVGGSNPLGTWGYIEAVNEIVQQLQQQPHLGPVTDICMACGSGGTSAGLALGSHLSSLGARVHAYGVCDTPEYFYNFIDGLFAGLGASSAAATTSAATAAAETTSAATAAAEGKGGTSSSISVDARSLLRVVQSRGSGYAISTDEELRTTQAVSAATGVVLDPVYGGKAVYCMLREMYDNPHEWRGRTVLFVHTGGLLGMYDKLDQLGPLVQAHGPRVARMQVQAVPRPPREGELGEERRT
ncbi:hypothetical protein Agub_g8810 [Astrephomene gubernaculifera]|uniref:Tryptophan synthase beta chain-like PALP domain-containing protein n=1 Tax=Astrephomene gubernaculifera TaxID=47775 RepID=A0AAD3DV09_9CHLO|nr:hypothetical protein Agub_g8810 [Astrephomene gubernaculifera]